MPIQRVYDTERGTVMAFVADVIWTRPEDSTPPFNEPVLVVLGSWLNRGAGFQRHTTVSTVRIMQQDTTGDEDEGEKMRAELESGETAWSDLQFLMLDDDDDELSAYSDSIQWWSAFPDLPDPTSLATALGQMEK